MRILLLAVAGAVMVLGSATCQTDTSKNGAAKAEVASLIQNSETFKLPASLIQLSLGKFLASEYEPRTSVHAKDPSYEPKNSEPLRILTLQNLLIFMKSLTLFVISNPPARRTVRAISTSRMIRCFSSG